MNSDGYRNNENENGRVENGEKLADLFPSDLFQPCIDSLEIGIEKKMNDLFPNRFIGKLGKMRYKCKY